MFFLQPAPAPPVSYSRQIAAVFALHCNGCHGDAGGLSTRSYRELMKGGNLGKVIVPGDPESSLLVHFLDGRRGEAHRMPLGGQPLGEERMAAIRRWIAEGAKEDTDSGKKHEFAISKIRVERRKLLRFFCQVNTAAYLTLTLFDPRNRRVLLTEVASIKLPQERNDAGRPGQLITWEVRPERGWPRWIAAELIVSYAEQEPQGTVFFVKTADRQ